MHILEVIRNLTTVLREFDPCIFVVLLHSNLGLSLTKLFYEFSKVSISKDILGFR